MANEVSITPEVREHLTSMDVERIAERAERKYYYSAWNSYKGHVRGLLTGTTFGAATGAGLGLAFAVAATAPVAIPIMAGAGLLVGFDSIGSIGASASSRAATLARKHARYLDPENPDMLDKIDDVKLSGGGRNNYEYSDKDSLRLFSWRSGFAGTLIGAGAGALTAKLALLDIPGAVLAMGAIGLTGPIAPLIAGAAAFGLLGLTFGIDRGIFKGIFNQVELFTKGKIREEKLDIGREQARGKETDQELKQHRIQRQEDIHYLQADYDKRIFMGASKGYFRGAVGGVAVGILTGAVLGLAVTGILALFAIHAAILIPIATAACGMYYMKTFAETGKEGGAESVARAIDDEFEHGRVLRERGITEEKQEESKGKTFSIKTGLLMGAFGLVAGVALAPIIGTGILGVLGAVGVSHLGTLALGGAAAQGFTAATVAASATAGGLTGTALGFNDRVYGAFTDLSSKIYDRTYNISHEKEAEQAEQDVRMSVHRSYTVTPAEAALLNERLGAGSEGKSFAAGIDRPQSFTDTIIKPSQASPVISPF